MKELKHSVWPLRRDRIEPINSDGVDTRSHLESSYVPVRNLLMATYFPVAGGAESRDTACVSVAVYRAETTW